MIMFAELSQVVATFNWFGGLLAISLLVGHAVRCARVKYITESLTALVIGALGGITYALWNRRNPDAQLVTFDYDVFFNVLLPPIIFYAGFSVKKKHFFENFYAIAMLGIFGTFISCMLLSAGTFWVLQSLDIAQPYLGNAMALATVFSSSDSVAVLSVINQEHTPVLYALIFGEGVINDATAIVLLKAIRSISTMSSLTLDAVYAIIINFTYLFFLSLGLGICVGLVSAVLVRKLFTTHSTDREVIIVGMTSFTAYNVAESLGLSGIFAAFFCGIAMSHYTWHSLSVNAKVITLVAFRTASFACELLLYIYLAFDMAASLLLNNMTEGGAHRLTLASWWKILALSGSLLLQVVASRALFVTLICNLVNLTHGSRISAGEMAVVWWSGCIRGAITIALTYHHYHSRTPPPAGVGIGDTDPDPPTPEDCQIIIIAAGLTVLATSILGGLSQSFIEWMLPNACLPGAHDSGEEGLLSMHVRFIKELDINSEGEEGLNGNGSFAPGTMRTPRTLHDFWRIFDHTWLQPFFGGSTTTRGDSTLPTLPSSDDLAAFERLPSHGRSETGFVTNFSAAGPPTPSQMFAAVPGQLDRVANPAGSSPCRSAETGGFTWRGGEPRDPGGTSSNGGP